MLAFLLAGTGLACAAVAPIAMASLEGVRTAPSSADAPDSGAPEYTDPSVKAVEHSVELLEDTDPVSAPRLEPAVAPVDFETAVTPGTLCRTAR